MLISLRRPAVAGPALVLLLTALFLLPARLAVAQDSTADSTTEETKTQKFLDHIDLAVEGAAELTNTVSGVEQRDATTTKNVLTIKPSRTVGELATLRYTAKPWVGFEFNFGNQRYTEDYTFTPNFPQPILVGGAQTGVHEITWGYIAHPPHQFFGLQPFLGLGGGTMSFHPTAGGGQHLPFQYRAAYYYTGGVDGQFPNSHFGMRAGFRQVIYLAPDFLQNYLTITRRVRTSEPNIGFYVRF
jgi:hypothetical protein